MKSTPKNDTPVVITRSAERSVGLEDITEEPEYPLQNRNEYQFSESRQDLDRGSPRSLDSNIHMRQTNEMRNQYFSNWNQPIMHDSGGASRFGRSWNDAVNYQQEHMGQTEYYHPWPW